MKEGRKPEYPEKTPGDELHVPNRWQKTAAAVRYRTAPPPSTDS